MCAGDLQYLGADPGFSAYADTIVVITEPPLLEITSSTASDVLCNGDCSGLASVTVTGGTFSSGYMYNWTNGATTPNISGLCPGAYECMVTDDNGCADSVTWNINEPSAISFTVRCAKCNL